MRKRIVEGKSLNKKLGGEKRKDENENQNDSAV